MGGSETELGSRLVKWDRDLENPEWPTLEMPDPFSAREKDNLRRPFSIPLLVLLSLSLYASFFLFLPLSLVRLFYSIIAGLPIALFFHSKSSLRFALSLCHGSVLPYPIDRFFLFRNLSVFVVPYGDAVFLSLFSPSRQLL